MKFVILLALVTLAVAQRPGFDHNDPLHHLIMNEVREIISNDNSISADDCAAKCDALFDLAAGHDEEMTDKLCNDECAHQLHMHHQPPQN